MRVSLNKIALIEKLIFNANSLSPEEKVLHDSYKILDADFNLEIENQKKTIDLIRKSGREELKQAIDAVHNNIFCEKSRDPLKERVLKMFSF